MFAVKLRLLDPDTDGLFDLCQAKMQRHADAFAHLAGVYQYSHVEVASVWVKYLLSHSKNNLEFVLYAARFDEASAVCHPFFSFELPFKPRLPYTPLSPGPQEIQTTREQFVQIWVLIYFTDAISVVRWCSNSSRGSLQVMLQGDTVPPEKLCYLFRRLITLAESKSSALEWLEQFVQLSGSVDVAMPEDDVEWLVAKSWNIVSQHTRLCDDGAQHVQQSWVCSGRESCTTGTKTSMMPGSS